MTAHDISSTDQSVGRSAGSRPNGRSIFPSMMDVVRAWWPSKAAEELAAILYVDVRSAERYLAGHRTPDADALIALIKCGFGAKLVALVAADMAPRQRTEFWKEMAKAARRSELLEERARLERELSQVGG